MHNQPDMEQAVAQDPWVQPGAKDRKVLVIEDDPDHRYFYSHLLRRAGYTVIEAADGPAGDRAAREAVPDLILLDIGVPGMTGWELARRIKATEELRHVPIIAISVYSFPQDRARSLAAGCAMHLEKPVGPREVLETVNQLLGVGRAAQ